MVDFSALVGTKPIRDSIRKLIARGRVSYEELQELRFNSYEWEALMPALTDECFLKVYEHCKNNCGHVQLPAITYDDAIKSYYADEVLRRFSGWQQWWDPTDYYVTESVKKLMSIASKRGYQLKILVKTTKQELPQAPVWNLLDMDQAAEQLATAVRSPIKDDRRPTHAEPEGDRQGQEDADARPEERDVEDKAEGARGVDEG